MLIREMMRQECEDVLARLSFGRLACSRDHQPYIVPIYFAGTPDCLYGFATMGQKIEWMRSNPLVCVEADEVRSQMDWASVVVRGRYEEFPDTPEYSKQRRQSQALLEKTRSLWWQTGFAAAQTRERFDRDITIFYCIHIDELTGRRASADPVEQPR
jgi:nitroimidazol reductase NimA-like FMN-containing flavoprotein (pyridoxamine 5'-phosphate oxidase superfamily)